VEHKKIFFRNKKAVKTKILRVLFYHRARSYRVMPAKTPRIIEPASYETLRYWHNQFKGLFIVGWKERRAIAIDETKVKREGNQIFLWTAVDVDSIELLVLSISET